MPSQINRVPPGLLSLLGIKSFGQNPTILSDLLQPVLDLQRYYFEAFSESLTGQTANINAVGSFEFTGSGTRLAAPPGELWIIPRICVRPASALTAGTAIKFAVAVIDSTSGWPRFAAAATTGAATEQPTSSLENVVVTATSNVSVWVSQYTAGTPQPFEYRAQVVRLTI